MGHPFAGDDEFAVSAAQPCLAAECAVVDAGESGEDRAGELVWIRSLRVGAIPFEGGEALAPDAVTSRLGYTRAQAPESARLPYWFQSLRSRGEDPAP
jgi:hypothetical protein